MPDLNATLGTHFQLRVGVHTGQAIAGVIGTA
jgi:class 3 adenylate cyclase